MVNPISIINSTCYYHRCYVTNVSGISSEEDDATTSSLELPCSVGGLSILRSTLARSKETAQQQLIPLECSIGFNLST
jgi:hypothetical protein